MCTCIPQLLAVLRNQYIIPIHTFHDVLSQKEGEKEYCIAINGIRGGYVVATDKIWYPEHDKGIGEII